MTAIERVYDLVHGRRLDGIFASLVHEREFWFERALFWNTDVTAYTGPGTVLARYDGGRAHNLILDFDNAIAKIALDVGEVAVNITAKNADVLPGVLAQIQHAIPKMEQRESHRPVTFWVYGGQGPSSFTRQLLVPSWGEVRGNYPDKVSRQLRALMEDGFQPEGGQLVLWQGEPGTGKTWALRALMWEWREWADFHYVIDPDKFFGDRGDYLIRVLLQGDSVAEDRWKILILEDSGEMLAQDARQRVGQALSRLLNVVDGIIGQGLQVLVLVTTNEELRSLHPAIQRPGRCAARIMFARFTPGESREWLTDRGIMDASEHERHTAMTLAELFAATHGRSQKETALLGFAV